MCLTKKKCVKKYPNLFTFVQFTHKNGGTEVKCNREFVFSKAAHKHVGEIDPAGLNFINI